MTTLLKSSVQHAANQSAAPFVLDRARFDALGYALSGPILSTTEVDEIVDLVERLRAEGQATLRGNNTFLTDPEATDPTAMRYVAHPRLLQAVMSVLGPDVDLFGSQFAVKQARSGSAFAWHQDSGYGHIQPADYLTVWLALDDATIENGTIWVLPGSHAWGRLEHNRSTANPNDMIGYPEDAPYQGVPVEAARGEAALFSSLTLHKSGTNRTDAPRRAWVLQYCVPGTCNSRTGHLYSKLALTRGGEAVSSNVLPYKDAAARAWGAFDRIEGATPSPDALADHAHSVLGS